MPGLTDAGANAMLDALGAAARLASLHEDDPGSTGAAEVSGGAYARQPIQWAASRRAIKATAGALAFDIPAGATLRFLGYWTADGTFLGSRPLRDAQPFPTAGTFTIPAGEVYEVVADA